MTFGLSELARHEPDEETGHKLMPSAWFLTELDDPTAARIADIVRRAATWAAEIHRAAGDGRG